MQEIKQFFSHSSDLYCIYLSLSLFKCIHISCQFHISAVSVTVGDILEIVVHIREV